MMTSARMLCPRCLKTSELDDLHLLDRTFECVWTGLTDEEVDELFETHKGIDPNLRLLIEDIEAKLKSKNTHVYIRRNNKWVY